MPPDLQSTLTKSKEQSCIDFCQSMKQSLIDALLQESTDVMIQHNIPQKDQLLSDATNDRLDWSAIDHFSQNDYQFCCQMIFFKFSFYSYAIKCVSLFENRSSFQSKVSRLSVTLTHYKHRISCSFHFLIKEVLPSKGENKNNLDPHNPYKVEPSR